MLTNIVLYGAVLLTAFAVVEIFAAPFRWVIRQDTQPAKTKRHLLIELLPVYGVIALWLSCIAGPTIFFDQYGFYRPATIFVMAMATFAAIAAAQARWLTPGQLLVALFMS